MPAAAGTLAIVAAFAGLFLGGAATGGALAEVFAPGSWVAAVAGFSAPGIPGSLVFLPLGSVAGAAAGMVVGLASSTHPAWLVALVYWLVGTGHGALAWRLARRGVLMPPESI